MIEALVLIITKSGCMKHVYRKTKLLRSVKKVEMLTGPHDLIALIEGEDINHLLNTTLTNIRNIDGVDKTTTNIIVSYKN